MLNCPVCKTESRNKIQLRQELDSSIIRKLYIEEGLTQQQLAEKFGWSIVTIHDFMKSCGIERRKTSSTSKKNKVVDKILSKPLEIIDLVEFKKLYYKDGLSQKTIAQKYKVSEALIRRYMIRNNIDKRIINVGHKGFQYLLRGINPDEIRKLYYEKRMWKKDIAKLYNVSISAIQKYMILNNITVRQKRLVEQEEKEDIFNHINLEQFKYMYYEEGMLQKDIAKFHGISVSTLYKMMDFHKMERKHKKTSKRDREICNLRIEGLTLANIGKKFNITRERVRQILTYYNVSKPKNS